MNLNSRLSQYRSKPVHMIKITDPPTGHEQFVWVSQDGKVTLIHKLDDRHLINIYRILKKSDDWLSNLSSDTDTFDLFYENKERLNHVEYEIDLRGLIISNFEIYKSIQVKTVFELLKMGCQIQFPNGYILKGDPQASYIETSMIIGGELETDGLRALDETGTVNAIEDAMAYEGEFPMP